MALSVVQKGQRADCPQAARGLRRALLSVEWKLFLRNRRPRLALMVFGFVLLVGLASALSHSPDGYSLVLYLMLTVPISSFLLICRSRFYDGLLARPVSESHIAWIVVYAFHVFAALFFGVLVVASALVRGDWGDVFMTGASGVYVLGVGNYLLAFAVTAFQPVARMNLNLKFRDAGHGDPYRVDTVSKDAIPSRWIVLVFWVLAVLSMAFVVSLYFFSQTREIIFPTIAVLGLAGLLFHARWIWLITHILERRRYELLERFRAR